MPRRSHATYRELTRSCAIEACGSKRLGVYGSEPEALLPQFGSSAIAAVGHPESLAPPQHL